jgi:hypothetical protein
MEKKPWYKSKIVLLALAAVLTIGGNALYGFLSGQGVTPEQLDAVANTQPAIAEAIKEYQEGQGILNSLSVVIFAAIAVIRRWFTISLLN